MEMEKSMEDLLLQAIRVEDSGIVSYAISQGANPNKILGHGRTCLGEAAIIGNIAILKILISASISCNGPNESPTHSSYNTRPVKAQKRKLNDESEAEEFNAKCKSFNDRSCNNNQGYFVVTHGESSSGSNGEGNKPTALKLPSTVCPMAVLSSPQPELEWDEEIGNVAPTTSDDETWSSMYKWYAAILETTGAAMVAASHVTYGIDQQDAFGRTALHYAAEKGHIEVVNLLIDADCKVDTVSRDGTTALHIAVSKNYIDIAKSLLGAGSDINNITYERMTSLHYAAKKGYLDMVKILVKNGAFLDARNANEKTPLHHAAGKGCIEIVKHLISCGANVNGADFHGYTPLCEAVWQKHFDIVALLLKCGARVTHSHRLLHNAIFHKQEEIIKLLTNSTGGLNLYNDNGDTPLLLATRLAQPKIAKILLSKGANVNLRNSITGSSVLHIAIETITKPEVFEDFLNYLLEFNVNLDAKTLTGDTALNRALLLDIDHAVELFVRHGADVNICEELYGLDTSNLSIATKKKTNYLANMVLKAGHRQIIFKQKVSTPTESMHQKRNQNCSWLQYACRNPLNLADICRIKIRSLRRERNMLPYISSLPLPNCMIRFLMMEDGIC